MHTLVHVLIKLTLGAHAQQVLGTCMSDVAAESVVTDTQTQSQSQTCIELPTFQDERDVQ